MQREEVSRGRERSDAGHSKNQKERRASSTAERTFGLLCLSILVAPISDHMLARHSHACLGTREGGGSVRAKLGVDPATGSKGAIAVHMVTNMCFKVRPRFAKITISVLPGSPRS